MKDASPQKITGRTSEGKPLAAKGEPGITVYPAGRILIHREFRISRNKAYNPKMQNAMMNNRGQRTMQSATCKR
ncbi:putative hemicentin-2-like [Sesbania bispinosa]|nr:putative hemicentin-2-like [Sesbania bispinosa]